MTDNEQSKLKNDILNELKQENKKKFAKIINSPFVVTVIGGLLITFMAKMYQIKAANIDQNFKIWEQQKKTFVSFSRKFLKSAKYALDYKYRELWVERHKDDPNRDKVKYKDDGNNYQKTEKLYHEMFDKYSEYCVEMLYAEILVNFESEEVRGKATRLYNTMNDLILATSDDDVKKAYRVIGQEYDTMIKEMALEIDKKGRNIADE